MAQQNGIGRTSHLADALQHRRDVCHVVLDGLQECLMVTKVPHHCICAPGCGDPACRLVPELCCQQPGFLGLPAQLLLLLECLCGRDRACLCRQRYVQQCMNPKLGGTLDTSESTPSTNAAVSTSAAVIARDLALSAQGYAVVIWQWPLLDC